LPGNVSRALLHKRKVEEARNPVLQKERRREYILHKWEIFTRNIYEKDGKIYFRLNATKVHIRDLKDCLNHLCEVGQQNDEEEAVRTESSRKKIKDCTEKFLAVSEECSELRRRLALSESSASSRRADRRLSV